MSIPVIALLKPVQVKTDQAQGAAIALDPIDFIGKGGMKIALVKQVGQSVGDGEFMEFFLQGLLVGQVMEKTDTSHFCAVIHNQYSRKADRYDHAVRIHNTGFQSLQATDTAMFLRIDCRLDPAGLFPPPVNLTYIKSPNHIFDPALG